MPETIQSALATMPLGVVVKWLLLFFPLVSLGIWHYFQDKGFDYLMRNPSARTFEALQKLARLRSYQVIAVWLIAFVFIIVTDVSHQAHVLGLTQEAATEQPATVEPVVSAPQTPASAATTPQATVASPIPEQPGNKEEQLDTLKQRYEDMLISFFFLDRCGKTGPQDLEIINNFMTRDLNASGAASSLHDGIFSAAQGSYESVYEDTPCKPKFVDPTLKIYNEMLAKLKNP